MTQPPASPPGSQPFGSSAAPYSLQRGPTLPRLVLALTFFVLFLTVLVAALGVWDRYTQALDGADRQLRDLAMTLAEQADRSFQTADLILRSTEQDVFRTQHFKVRDRADLDNVLRARVSGISHIQGHSAFDARGRYIASSRPQRQTADLQALDGFRFIKNTQDAVTFVSPAYHFREYPRPAIPVVRRVASPTGEFMGIVSVAIEPDDFNRFYETLQRNAPYRIRLTRTDGIVVAGEGAQVFKAGEKTPLPLPVPANAKPAEVRSSTVDGPDNQRWASATGALVHFPLRVEVSLPEQWVLAAWRKQAWGIGLVALAICLLLGVLGIGMCRELVRSAQVEHQLSAQSRMLQAVFDTVPHPVFLKDAEGRYREVNRAMADYWRMTPEQFRGQSIVAPALREQSEIDANLSDDQAVLTEGREISAVRPTTFPDGRVRQFHVIRRPLRDESGRIVGLVGTAVDQTDRLAAEQQLLASRELLATIFDTVPHHIWMKDREGKLVLANRTLERYVGVPVESMKGLRIVGAGYRPPEENARIMEEDRRVLELGESLDVTQWAAAPDGQRRRFHVVKRPLHDNAGKVSGLVAISMDITDHTRAEEALQQSQTLLKAVFDAIPLSLLVKDLDDRLLVVNPQTAARWGLPSEQLVGKRVKELDVPADERSKIEETDAQVIREDRILDYELERTMPDGKTRRLRAIKAPLHGIDGKVVGILAMSEDITERHRIQQERTELQRQLEQVQKMDTVGRLAGGVAHDFNNLLTPVIGFVDLALHRVGPEDPVRQELGMIREAATRAAELTRGLLSFSRSQVLSLRPVNLNDEIRSISRMLSRVIGEGIEIVLNLDPALDLIHADTTQMHQLLMNLAVNARDAMPRGGKLVIESRNIALDAGYAERILETTPGSYVMVSVSDTGVGMSPDVQARVFEPFFTTKETGKGTGLGLSIVYGIVRQHHGSIRVYSEVGRGTSFKLLFPRHSSSSETTPTPQRPLDRLRGSERILVVEDEARVRDAVCALLGSLGYEVLQAASPRDALNLLGKGSAGRVALLIADMMLPGQTGRELYTTLKQREPYLNVLFMSGYPRDVLTDAAAAVGADRFIGKPFGLHDLAEKVRTILESGAPN